jgi:uncharacterized SAM-binding protein YcdF (DUF218 family)
MPRRSRRLLLVIAALSALDLVAVAGYAWAVQRHVRQPPPGARFDAAVVFFSDHQRLSQRTLPLLDAAARLQAAGTVRFVFCVGGNRPASGYHGCAEAGAWLAQRGVPATRIATDLESRDTLGNMRAAARLTRERGVRSALLLAHAWHMPRVLALAAEEWPEAQTLGLAPPLDGWGPAWQAWEHWRSAHHEAVSWLLWKVFGERALGALVAALRA